MNYNTNYMTKIGFKGPISLEPGKLYLIIREIDGLRDHNHKTVELFPIESNEHILALSNEYSPNFLAPNNRWGAWVLYGKNKLWIVGTDFKYLRKVLYFDDSDIK